MNAREAPETRDSISVVTITLILLYTLGLILRGRTCSAIAFIIMFIPQALIAAFAAYSFYKRDYLTGAAAIVMLLEIGLLMYLKAIG